MSLKDINSRIDGIEYNGNMATEFRDIKIDSREVVPGDLFVAVQGFKTDGHLFISDAIARGAVVVIIDREIDIPGSIPWIRVPDSRKALSSMAAHLNNFPSQDLRIIGVTGTNGKTTTTHLIEAILNKAGKAVGLIGTIENRIIGKPVEVALTTPESIDLQRLLSQMVGNAVDVAVMEVSSHALKLGRVEDCEFDAAVFTNLSQDHMDFHPDVTDYLASKTKLFSELHLGKKRTFKYAVVNADDSNSRSIIEHTNVPVITYGIDADADIRAENIDIGPRGTSFTVCDSGTGTDLRLKLVGRFNIYNALASWGVAIQESIHPNTIKAALGEVKGIPGRFEIVDAGQNFGVVVDYAHTPDSLYNILRTARDAARRKVITVFGCGGDRDKSKRSLMGEAAALNSDFCVVTSDNPRSEAPGAIIRDILPGVVENTNNYRVQEDRRVAIEIAINMASKGDLVVIAGKGHETYQIIGDRVDHFDDREEARRVLRGLRQ